MDNLSLIFEKLSLTDKNEISETIEKIDKTKIDKLDDLNNICESLNNLKLDNFDDNIKPIIKKTIITNVINIGMILKNKQKCIFIQKDNFIPKYIF